LLCLVRKVLEVFRNLKTLDGVVIESMGLGGMATTRYLLFLFLVVILFVKDIVIITAIRHCSESGTIGSALRETQVGISAGGRKQRTGGTTADELLRTYDTIASTNSSNSRRVTSSSVHQKREKLRIILLLNDL
jgi:hypothetical protein